ncbi:VCBS repeat-containing protein [Croceitalea sp. MTPC9]|uniref:VCBS repeat-containing protein n=1 Tax=unclassified Croceitalea TaxID=2632280 RepID=UPI002B3F5BAD|nr:VCBS repeat-containing protein [Croceitalea sp. MTPC6]GMN17747.1 VCBS repeat-containing protein [Croceitalea sp. MTPC9]
MFIFFLLSLFSCGDKEATNDIKTRFSLLSSNETGINFSNDVKDAKEHNILRYANYYGGSGVGVGDFNNDGLQDLYFAGNIVPDKLYLNRGNLKFEDVTDKAGIMNDGGWSTGVTIADVNSDGHQDIYVSRELYDDNSEWRTNLLYINNGDGTFKENAKAYGVADNQRTRHSTFLDYNSDGLLDLLLLTQPPNPGSLSPLNGTELLKPEYSLKLLKNTGAVFLDVTEEAGINKTGFPNAVSVSDLNNDGHPDLYIANDFYVPDFLFMNNGDGTFSNTADQSLKHMPYYSMGVDIADINNDGLNDIFVVDMVAEDNFRLKSNMSGMDIDAFWKVVEDGGHYQYMYNTVQKNNGNSTFSDVAQFTGMQATDWSWSNLLADFDNDGLKDAYITNGLLRDIRNTDADNKVAEYINKTRAEWLVKHPDGGSINSAFDIINVDEAISFLPSQPLKNYVFKNNGNFQFSKVMEDWGFDEKSFSNGSAYADFDNDGDLDLIVNNINEEAFLYRNNSESLPNSNYLRVKLVDKENKSTFGVKVRLVVDTQEQFFETTNVRGIYSTSEPYIHFGVGNHEKIDTLEVFWPNGDRTLKTNLKSNRVVELAIQEAKPFLKNNILKNNTLFSEVSKTTSLEYSHQENEFDDFEYQILLPHKMSQFGPALAKADINSDGLDDLYIGGASGFEPVLMIQGKDGEFTKSNPDFWKKEAPYEDVDAVFFDVNGDGAKDLYVVSGGNEYAKNNFHYADRLYLNDGNGNFKKGALLNADRNSGSKIVIEDYDKDGDLDVFVGGRHEPQRYPTPASSTFFVNDNGSLINKTSELAPEFKDLGMVTDASWFDYDKDNDLDLIIVGEWMPITIFLNENGKMVKQNIPTFESTTGWWFSITSGDFDADGDMDFIAGNLGLNYKYKTSPEEPFDIYYKDFDNNGSGDIVLGYHNNDKHYPLRGFSCSSEQIPGLKTEIKKYDLFASMEINEVYGETNLENALHYQADTFASYYVENLGNGEFKMQPLPNEAQWTNLNDVLVKDFNGDGNLDVLAVGNLYVSEIETPRSDAGTGILLLGDGSGNFMAINTIDSGFFASGDAKGLVDINIKGKNTIVVANNNDKLQLFEWNKKR